jgi:hypothetical protein
LVLTPGQDGEHQDDWQPVSDAILARYTISHSICPGCREKMQDEIRKGSAK